ncbi:MAG: hypothetical protein WCT01_03700 [Candidatus Shapirobacteria bacterium]|jgi:hypothetical protein
MKWQDFVLTFGQVIFILALFPSIFSKDKPSIKTSIPTSLVSFSIGVVYLTLNVPMAAATAVINGILWGILAFQKLKVK